MSLLEATYYLSNLSHAAKCVYSDMKTYSGKVDCNLMRWGKPSSSWEYSYRGMYWSLLLKLSVVVNSLKVTKHFDKVGENPGVVVKYILQW